MAAIDIQNSGIYNYIYTTNGCIECISVGKLKKSWLAKICGARIAPKSIIRDLKAFGRRIQNEAYIQSVC